MNILVKAILAATMLFANIVAVYAQDKTRVPPIETYKAMLDGTRQSGWVQFRNYEGKQYVYFTPLQNLHCRLSEVRYSINSEALDQTFDLVDCNPQTPFSLPSNVGIKEIGIILDLGTVKTLAVQATWEDGTKSDMAIYEPCENVGDQACSWPLN